MFDNPNNAAITLLVATQDFLYVGFDNSVDGVFLVRTAADAPTAMSDFEGDSSCVAGVAGCEGIGGNGFGDPATNPQFLSSLAIAGSGTEYLYLLTGGGSGPLQLYRQSH